MSQDGKPLSDWLTWLETLSPREIDLGLDRVHAVMSRLPLEYPAHILMIAGTNGKGSSVAMATALLRAAGYRTGAYTSPHIVDYNGRIAIGERFASDEEIVAAFETIEAVRDDVPLTYFEYGTLAAFVLFSRAGLDVWVLEVGMGGRLDAVNAVEPTAALITNVALDHCDWLGNDIETIAAEKAGVMRPDTPVIFGGADVPRSIVDHAEGIGARLLLPGRDFDADGLPQPSLLGDFQVRNAAAVIALLDAAGLSKATDAALVAEVLPGVKLDGRSQRIVADGIEWHLDVAHNPAAAEMLGATLGGMQREGDILAIIGMLDDKDVEGVVAPLNEYIGRWIAVAADSHRAIPEAELARRIANHSNRPCLVAESLSAAIEIARQEAGENDTILVTGSFYLVGPALQQLELYSRPDS